jgi:hypothetical protein
MGLAGLSVKNERQQEKKQSDWCCPVREVRLEDRKSVEGVRELSLMCVRYKCIPVGNGAHRKETRARSIGKNTQSERLASAHQSMKYIIV